VELSIRGYEAPGWFVWSACHAACAAMPLAPAFCQVVDLMSPYVPNTMYDDQG
jgi:hypothetical protein